MAAPPQHRVSAGVVLRPRSAAAVVVGDDGVVLPVALPVGTGPDPGPVVAAIAAAATGPLDAVTVDLRDAADVSAPQLSGPGRQPFTGSVPAGGSATGVYVFGLATGARSDVTVRLTYDGAAPTVVFRGSV